MAHADLIPQGYEDSKTMKLSEVAALLGVSTKTIHEWYKAGRLPTPTQVGPKTFLFRVKDLREAFQRMDSQPKRRRVKK